MLCYAKSLQSWPTLCDPIDVNPPGSPAPGILQARTVEWVAICFSFSPSGLEPSIESRTIFVLDAWQVASVTQFVVSVAGMIDDSCWEILEKAMATHSSTLAWKIPWKEEPGGLLSMGSHRVGHD